MSSVVRKFCSYHTLKKRLPILRWLPQYSLQWLRMDLLAGLTVGLTVVPQGLAYAEIAGLPVQYGLYSSFMGCFVYCLLGTSKDITLGPTAIMSLLVASYANHDPVYAVLLAFLCGCIQLAMGILQLGFLVDFISYPVIKGFTSSAALTIGFGQVKGYQPDSQSVSKLQLPQESQNPYSVGADHSAHQIHSNPPNSIPPRPTSLPYPCNPVSTRANPPNLHIFGL